MYLDNAENFVLIPIEGAVLFMCMHDLICQFNYDKDHL